MKKNLFTYIILLAGILLIHIGCDDNSRSLGNFGIDVATVVPEGNNLYTLSLDNGKKMFPAATAVNYTPVENQRVFLNYTILSEERDGYDHYIKVNDIWNILTKQVIQLNAQNKDSIGNDPLKINAMWVGGDYLNVSFMFNFGGMRPHSINLVENTVVPGSKGETLGLELRPNS